MSDGNVPETIELLPPGENIIGRDGRGFKNSNPQGVIDAFEAHGNPLPIDFNHASESFFGGEAPAAGWMDSLAITEGGGIEAAVSWTKNGAERVKELEFRFISPAFFTNGDNVITEMSSAALTNNPNLDLKALNNANHKKKEPEMDKLLALLGLAPGSTEAQMCQAVSQVKSDLASAQAQTPSLDLYVPRADYDVALHKVQEMKAAQAETEKAALAKAIDLEINAAMEAGKITPATRDFYVANCHTEGGLERFKAFCAQAPVIGGTETNLGTQDPDTGDKALNEAEAHVAKQLGITVDEMKELASGTEEEI